MQLNMPHLTIAIMLDTAAVILYHHTQSVTESEVSHRHYIQLRHRKHFDTPRNYHSASLRTRSNMLHSWLAHLIFLGRGDKQFLLKPSFLKHNEPPAISLFIMMLYKNPVIART